MGLRLYNSATNALRGEAGGFAAVRVARNYEGVPSPDALFLTFTP